MKETNENQIVRDMGLHAYIYIKLAGLTKMFCNINIVLHIKRQYFTKYSLDIIRQFCRSFYKLCVNNPWLKRIICIINLCDRRAPKTCVSFQKRQLYFLFDYVILKTQSFWLTVWQSWPCDNFFLYVLCVCTYLFMSSDTYLIDEHKLNIKFRSGS